HGPRRRDHLRRQRRGAGEARRDGRVRHQGDSQPGGNGKAAALGAMNARVIPIADANRKPGSVPGFRKTRATPKGRTVDPSALAEVRALLGDAPRRRDLLIEYLHRIQDTRGYITPAHIVALAQELKL